MVASDAGRERVLVAGATGYIGRRLVTELLAHGYRVRCLARTPNKLDAEPWRAQVEVVEGDVLDPASLTRAFCDVDVAYYLVHSIGAGPYWQEESTPLLKKEGSLVREHSDVCPRPRPADPKEHER